MHFPQKGPAQRPAALSQQTETKTSFSTCCILHRSHFLPSFTSTSEQNSVKSCRLLIFSTPLAQGECNCTSAQVKNPQLLPRSDSFPEAVLWAKTELFDIRPSQPTQHLAKQTKYEQGLFSLTLSTTRQVFNWLEYNLLFLFTVMTEECTGVFTHRYKNLFIYRVTIIFNWEITLCSWSILTKDHRKKKKKNQPTNI